MIRFGAPVFCENANNYNDPEWLVSEHKMKGYTAAYAPRLNINQTDEIKITRETFDKAGIMISETGYWENLMDLDLDCRAKNRKAMVDTLALAEELGAQCAVDIFGSYCQGKGDAVFNEKNFSEEAFEEAVYMARYFIDEVKPKTAYFTYEVFPFNIVDSPESIERLIKAVDRDMFGVHLDLTNLVNCPRVYWNTAGLINDCIKRFGNRIVSCHVKDIKMREPSVTVSFEEVIAGKGIVDFAAYINAIHKLPREVPFMLEHLSCEREYDEAAAQIRAVSKCTGVIIP